MAVYVEDLSMPETKRVSWTQTTEDWKLNRSEDPEAVGYGEWCLVVGMDGAHREHMHRSKGYRLWMDPLRCTNFRTSLSQKVQTSAGSPRCVDPSDKVVLGVVPFAISKSDAGGYCYGAVYSVNGSVTIGTDTYDHTYITTHNLLVWKTSLTADVRDPTPQSGAVQWLPNKSSWEGRITSPPLTDSWSLWQRTLHGFSWGRHLYLFSNNRYSAKYPWEWSTVLWYGDAKITRYPTTAPANEVKPASTVLGVWYIDLLGTPEAYVGASDADVILYNSGGETAVGKDPTTYVRGSAEAGVYASGSRLVDSERNRIGPTFFQPVVEPSVGNENSASAFGFHWATALTIGIDRSTLLAQCRISKSYYNADPDPEDYEWPFICSQSLTGTSFGCYVWDRWQPLLTLSSQNINRPPAGQYFVVDELPTHDDFRKYDWTTKFCTCDSALGTGASQLLASAGAALCYVWKVDAAAPPDDADIVQRSETYHTVVFRSGSDNLEFEAQYVPMVDEALAIQPQYDPALDTFIDWREMGRVLAACPYNGGTVVLADLFEKGVGSPTVAAVDRSLGELTLLWSDPRGSRMENFPVSCYCPTDYRCPPFDPIAVGLVKHSFEPSRNPDAFQLVQAGNNVYCFGDGPVYRLTATSDLPTGMFVGQIAQGVRIVSPYAAVSFGAGLVVVSDRGIFVLDAATDTLMEIEELSSIIRQRWVDPTIRASISVAFDPVVQCVHILCGRTGEMVRLWLGSNKITFEECTGFMYARQAPICEDGVSTRTRALLITPHGKIYYPADDELDDVGSHTMHGLVTYTGSAVRPAQCHAYVETATEVAADDTNGRPRFIKLHLHKSATDSTTITIDPIYATDMPVEVLTGTNAGKTYLTYWQAPADISVTGFELLLLVPATVTAASLAGTTILLSPIHSYVVGGPLPGQTARRLLERIQASSVIPGLVRPRGDFVQTYGTAPSMLAGVCTAEAIIATDVKTVDTSVRGQYQVALDTWLDTASTHAYLAATPRAGVTWDDDKPYLAYVAVSQPTGQAAHTLFPVFWATGGSWNCYLQWLSVEGIISTSQKAR